jgi:hypothetical protein
VTSVSERSQGEDTSVSERSQGEVTSVRKEPPTMGKQSSGKLYHLRLRVECTLFCNLQSRARTHAISQPQVIKFTRTLLAHGRWFFSGTPASSTTKTGRKYIGEILLKVALNTNNQKSISHPGPCL